MLRIVFRIFFTLPLFFWFAACKPNPPEEEPVNGTSMDLVAQVGDREITLDALQAEVTRAHGRASPESVLERMIGREALLYYAQEVGVTDDPEVQKRIDGLIIGELKRSLLEPRLENVEVSDDEIETVYTQRTELFVEPEQRRLAIIYALDKEGQAAERVSMAKSEAAELSAEQGFAQLALKYSNDKRSRYRGGDIGWVKRDQFPASVPDSLVEVGFALRSPGDVSEPIQLEDGWGLVKLIETRPVHVQPLDEAARKMIEALLNREKKEKIILDFREEVIAHAGVTILQPDWAAEFEPSVEEEKELQAPPLP
ncbi:peptidylprolyl isomerase [Cerasicoccus frondis]|uniref:peptidylprolyl isomerase n=1 Tax=Cerasicoccus frondis TaxID=490090 RepID=UPI002852A5AC|nr:peptidyl-prolyl cis-trans isomerase [Cerasicoccus frondis]